MASALAHAYNSLLPIQTSFASTKHTVYVPDALQNAERVFIKNENRKPLKPNYLGPFKVKKLYKNHFVVEIRGVHQSVALDRLKPAFLADPTQPPTYHFGQYEVSTKKYGQN